tara:strand:+ start:1849 stop:2877 length:1029 start_codon:yes stop_codon:yes gene_type:complete
MGFGMILNPNKITDDNVSEKSTSIRNTLVEVQDQDAEPIISSITAQGHVMPNREVTLRAETNGRVNSIILQEGVTVKRGEAILNLNQNGRKEKLAKAISKTKEEQHKYSAAKKLYQKGHIAKTSIDEAYVALKTAESEEKQIRLEIEKTTIVAPFDGIIDKQQIEVGDYLSVGDQILTIVDNNPLIVSVQVSQHDISTIYNNQKVEVKFLTGQKKSGEISFIAPRADQATRTFRVEIKVQNLEGLPSGISAIANIPKKSVMSHFLSPALLTLNKKGETGIKIVNKDSIVEFYPVTIITARPNGIYVGGLPTSSKIITSGQGFVSAGEKVSYVFPEKYTLALK